MTTGNWSSRIRGYGTLALMVTVTMLGMSVVVEAQQVLERPPLNNDEVWKVNVTSALLPGKMEGKLRAKIEADRLVCRSVDSTILEIPLTAITRITRDSGKDYPVAEFLMGVATLPSNGRHTFGTKEYRKEMAGRAMLVAFAFVGLLFPKHKEVVLVSWKDESGEHDAEFRLGRTQGRTMLRKLQQETGLEPRDLEMERKDIEKGKKELRRWMKKKSEHPTKKPSVWPGRYILKRMWVAYMPVSRVGPLTLIFLARLVSAETVQRASADVQRSIPSFHCKTLKNLIMPCYPSTCLLPPNFAGPPIPLHS